MEDTKQKDLDGFKEEKEMIGKFELKFKKRKVFKSKKYRIDMPSEESWIRSEVKEIIFYIFITIFLAVSFPWIIGLSLRGFESSFIGGKPLEFGSYLVSSILYLPFLLATLSCIIFPIGKLMSMKQNEHPATKPNPSWFRIFTVSVLHSPESNGLLYYLSEQMGRKGKNNFMRWSLNPLRLLMASIILFGIFGILLVANPQIAVSGIPAQQVTEISEISFGAFIPAVTENGSLLFLFMFFLGIGAYISARYKLGMNGFFAIAFLVIFICSGIWVGYHFITYGNLDSSLIATAIFAFIGLTITLLFASFIPFLIWHIMNNTFLILNKMITLKEDIYLITIIFLVVLTILWISAELLLRKKKPQADLSIPGS